MHQPLITLRPWTLDDLGSLVQHANNARIAAWLTNTFPHPYDEEDGRAFIKMTQSHHHRQIWAIDRAGEAIGSVGVFPQHDVFARNAEIGYWLAEPYWRQGIMAQAIGQLLDYAWSTFDLHRIYARPFGDNTGSIRVLEKLGFVKEGHLRESIWKGGRYHDELIYSLLRPDTA
ncbi:MAG: N-acetyltransferase [Bacteroidetes bacterium]|nr:MAG: N-acetyltransferase [Bacteroidota bacterium]